MATLARWEDPGPDWDERDDEKWSDPQWLLEVEEDLEIRHRRAIMRLTSLKRRPFKHHSHRRRALFAKARKILTAAARIRRTDVLVYQYTNSRGVPAGMYINLSRDEEMAWNPRDGFKVRAIDNIIPF